MVTDALMGLLHTLLGWLFSVLPSWSLTLDPSISSAISMVKAFDILLPCTETFAAIAVIGGVFTAMNVLKWSVKIVDWIADVIP